MSISTPSSPMVVAPRDPYRPLRPHTRQSPPPVSTLHLPRDLHALELLDCDARVLLSWLGLSGISLHSVSLRRISANDTQPFLDAICPSLEEFWCEPRFEGPHGASSPAVSPPHHHVLTRRLQAESTGLSSCRWSRMASISSGGSMDKKHHRQHC